ncbi:MAG TPA: hypothetical protein PLD59_03065 [Tepidisphaeraceae bacterium]|nr:hypothetical protein [Tepidisphaeraceae bacterium]
MTEPIDPQMPMHAAIAPDGAVSQDLPCRKCSYNLRGLTLASRCPECGTAVGYSAQGDLLRFSDPNWVDKLRYGVNLTIAGVVVAIFGTLALVLLSNSLGTGPAQLLMVANAVIIYSLFFVGAWLITQPDPSGLGEDQYGAARRLIRITLLIGLANTLLQLAPEALEMPETVITMLQLMNVVASIIAVVGTMAQLKYFAKLNLRIPDAKLASRANFLFWALGIPYIILVLMGGLALLLAGSGNQAIMIPIGLATGIAGLLVLIFGIMSLLLIERMGKRFKEQAAIARQSWAAAVQE